MIKFSPTPAQLNGALEHTYYEIARLTESLIGTNSTAINNALVESRLIHVRALLDFFQKSARRAFRGKELNDVLNECAKALKRAGARQVNVLTIARATLNY